MAPKRPTDNFRNTESEEATKSLGTTSLVQNPFTTGSGYEVTVGPDATVTLGLPFPARGVMVIESPFLVQASITERKRNKTVIRFTRQYEHIEHVAITTDITSFDFDAKINGNTDHEFLLTGYWKQNINNPKLRWRVNGADSSTLTNAFSRYTHGAGGGSTVGGLLVAIGTGSARGEHRVRSDFLTDRTNNRIIIGDDNFTYGATTTLTQVRDITGKWEDTSTTVTSLGLVTSLADNIIEKSFFDLYRRPQFDQTKIKIWVY